MAETAYIDKYKVYEKACAGCWYHGDEVGSCNLSEPCEKLVRAFASAPAADVAEVVRCRDCIYNIDGMCFSRTSFKNAVAVEPDNFCSWGATE